MLPMSWSRAPKTTPLSSSASMPRRARAGREAGHARPSDGRIEVAVAGAGQSGDVSRRPSRPAPAHPQGVADGRQERGSANGGSTKSSAPASMPAATGSNARDRDRRGISEDDDRHVPVGRVGADAPTRLDDIAYHRPDTHEHGVGLTDDDGRQGGGAEADRANGVAGVVERRGEGRVAARYILDDEDQSTAVIVGGDARAGCARRDAKATRTKVRGRGRSTGPAGRFAEAQNIVEDHGAAAVANIPSAAAAPGRHSSTRPAPARSAKVKVPR